MSYHDEYGLYWRPDPCLFAPPLQVITAEGTHDPSPNELAAYYEQTHPNPSPTVLAALRAMGETWPK